MTGAYYALDCCPPVMLAAACIPIPIHCLLWSWTRSAVPGAVPRSPPLYPSTPLLRVLPLSCVRVVHGVCGCWGAALSTNTLIFLEFRAAATGRGGHTATHVVSDLPLTCFPLLWADTNLCVSMALMRCVGLKGRARVKREGGGGRGGAVSCLESCVSWMDQGIQGSSGPTHHIMWVCL